MRFSPIITCLISFLSAAIYAQDPLFTQQFNNAPQSINPAYAAAENNSKAYMSFRNQWPGLTGNYVTYNIGYDHAIQKVRGGIGGYVVMDYAGESTLRTNSYNLVYAQQFELLNGNLVIRPSMQFSYFEKTIDWSKLSFGNQIDPKYGFIYPTNEEEPLSKISFSDLSGGLLVDLSNKFYIGYAVYHIFEPDEAFLVSGSSSLPRRHSIHLGGTFNASENVTLSPGVFFHRQHDFQALMVALNMQYKGFIAGLGYRHTDALLAAVGFNHRKWTLNYNYDVTISRLSSASGGSHEVSLAFRFLDKEKEDQLMRPVKRVGF